MKIAKEIYTFKITHLFVSDFLVTFKISSIFSWRVLRAARYNGAAVNIIKGCLTGFD